MIYVIFTNAVIWSRSFGHFRFRERGYLLTIYKYKIYIIVAVLTASFFDFDQMTNDQMTTTKKKSKNPQLYRQSIREPQC